MYIVLIFIVLLLVFSMVQNNKRRKQTSALHQAVEPGVRVMTTAGIYGLVTEVEADTIVVEISEGVDVRFDKRAIMKVVPHLDEEPLEETTEAGDKIEADDKAEADDTAHVDDASAGAEPRLEPAYTAGDDASGHEQGSGAVPTA